MRQGIQGLGWWVRRAQNPHALARFYNETIGLPLLRGLDPGRGPTTMLFSGDVAVFEIGEGPGPESPGAGPDSTEMAPVFRVYGVQTVRNRLEQNGAVFLSEDREQGWTVWLSDPAGFLFGLREADPDTDLPTDKIVASRRQTGQILPDGVTAMPEDIQDIGRIRMTVADVAVMTDFYTTVVGFDLIEETNSGALLHMGGSALLELAGGGTVRDAPSDRIERGDTWILRVYDYVGLKAAMASHGVQLVTTVDLTGGWLDYYTDPEGHMFGFQERRPPQADIPFSQLSEDIMARRRWESGDL